jgi:GntR family transcriptional regulator/MocR family aminotransferase
MELHVVINGRKDLAGQLYQQLRGAIESGRLTAGTQLPPSRLLAEQLGISRKTISDTYAQLTYENFLTGVIGKGTYVNARPAQIQRKQSHSELASAEVIESWRNLPVFLRHPTLQGSLRYDFIGGATSKGQFPHDDWRRCVSHAMRQMAVSKGFYSVPEGLPALRNAIARHIAFSRGINCQDEDIVVCNGAQQALDLITRVLIRPGSLVAMEEPGYPPARLLLQAQGAHVAGVPVDAEGLCVAQIPEGTRLIYTTPSHQFPLGMPMGAQRRADLLARAHDLGALVIEDDYDSEFRYEGRPNDALQSLDQNGRVAFIGSFSKTISPELRLGYLIAPPSIVEAVATAKHLSDWHTAVPAQIALAKFIAEGELQKHIRRCHTVYAARRERLMQRFNGDLAPWFEPVPTQAGFHLAALARRPLDMDMLLKLARRVDVGPLQP